MSITEIIQQAWPQARPGALLGFGSFGAVYQASIDGKLVAVKVCSVPKEEEPLAEDLLPEEKKDFYEKLVKDYENEILVMQKLSNEPNVVQVYDYKVLPQETGTGFHILYQMELLTPLNTYFSEHAPSPSEVRKLGADLCLALAACEANHVLHRDIKPDNIFVDKNGNFKLGDFGVARCLENLTSLYSRHGTANYMAPEVATMRRYDQRADIYSLGLVLYRQLNDSRLPFLSNERILSPSERSDALTKRLRGDALPAPRNADDAFANVILKACTFNPADRYKNASEFRKALQGLSFEYNSSQKQTTAKPSFPKKWLLGLTFGIVSFIALGASVFVFASPNLLTKISSSNSAPQYNETGHETSRECSETDSESSTTHETTTESTNKDSSEFKTESNVSESASSATETESESTPVLPPEIFECTEHIFGSWSLVQNDTTSGTEMRECRVCGYTEWQQHAHVFAAWEQLNDTDCWRHCTLCDRIEFYGPCRHLGLKTMPSSGSIAFSRSSAASQTQYEAASLSQCFYTGYSYYCKDCGRYICLPHRYGEPTYELQSDGTTHVIYRCEDCGCETSGDNFTIDADGHYLSHSRHYVASNQYTTEGLSSEEATTYHLILQCSCGEQNIKEEHTIVNGHCVFCEQTNSDPGSEPESDPITPPEVTECTEHVFTKWTLSTNNLTTGKETRQCRVCGYSESRTHTHVFSSWEKLNDTDYWRYCTLCDRVEFYGPCCHLGTRSRAHMGSLASDRRAKAMGMSNYEDDCIENSLYLGHTFYCTDCKRFICIPHLLEEPVYETQPDGTTHVIYHCKDCDFVPSGDNYTIDANGHYLSHSAHYVASNQYSLNGLTDDDSKTYHIILQCSCGEKNIKEEHVFVDGFCALCGAEER